MAAQNTRAEADRQANIAEKDGRFKERQFFLLQQANRSAVVFVAAMACWHTLALCVIVQRQLGRAAAHAGTYILPSCFQTQTMNQTPLSVGSTPVKLNSPQAVSIADPAGELVPSGHCVHVVAFPPLP